jgi:hypothetical protein
MNPEEFERRVHDECLRILRFLASQRYDAAGRCVAALALLAEEQTEIRSISFAGAAADPYDLKLLEAYKWEEGERD